MSYAAFTDRDKREMLHTIGTAAIDDLFEAIPVELRQRAHFDLPTALSEMEERSHFSRLAARNANAEESVSFLGAGSYDHYIPAVVPAIASRGEFATAYTPYQAEVSQGTLQVIYEWQTLLCELTQMEMANASLYDGATALAEAVLMANAVTKRSRILMPRTVSPFYRRVVHTYTQGLTLTLEEIDSRNGATALADIEAQLGADVAAVVVQQPNFFGSLEEMQALAESAHKHGALLIVVFNPVTLGMLPPPGSYGADIAVGEGQPLGIASQFGGPGLGLFCCRKQFARLAPGRLVGTATDAQDRTGFTLTLQTREQHIRREKATSNICSNQALCALMATVHLAALGPRGLQTVAAQSFHKAHYAAQRLTEIPGVELAFETPFFHEFALRLPRPMAEVNARLRESHILGGYDLSRDYPELENVSLWCCTEKRTRAEIDHLIETLAKVL
ncbi:MAG: glycine dehydrogenase subunit 1 [Abditibacteriota bacterium]|nr:glycine dehydrogenase subunit 1 [Abditibacteriota bacterium]